MVRYAILPLVLFLAAPAFAQGQAAPLAAASRDSASVEAAGVVDRPRCRVGDTVRYTLKITWSVPRGQNILLKPYTAPQAQGLDIVRQTQRSSKKFLGGRDVAALTNEIVYKCVEIGEHKLGPVSIPYQSSGSSEADLTATAEAVTVIVKPGLLARIRESGKWRYAVFAGGIAAFWIVARAFRRRKKRELAVNTAVQNAQDQDARGVSPWMELEDDAHYTVTGEFFARIEDLVWSELFAPAAAPAGTASTRISILSQQGYTIDELNDVRRVVNSCQVARYTDSVSLGDAQTVLAQARRVVDAHRRSGTPTA